MDRENSQLNKVDNHTEQPLRMLRYDIYSSLYTEQYQGFYLTPLFISVRIQILYTAK